MPRASSNDPSPADDSTGAALPQMPQWQRPIPDLLPEYRQVEPPIYGHFGIYAVCYGLAETAPSKVLVIRKARGPYTGLLDLPGGTPEREELREETLARELAEETGGRIVVAEPQWHEFAFCVVHASDGTRVGYDHRGLFKRVRLTGIAPTGEHPASQADVAGLHWLELASWRSRGDLSSALRSALHAVEALPPLPSG